MNAVGVSSEASDVEIGLKDFLLGVLLFHTNREFHFVELALETRFDSHGVGRLALFRRG